MSTVLRAYGVEFDVDSFLKGCTLPICAVKRRGEPAFPKSQPDGRRHQESGLHIIASNADFNDFPGQIADTIAFLQNNTEQLHRLSKWPGIEWQTLDFGIHRRDVAVQCDSFPPELLRLAGGLEISLELTQYPVAKPEDEEELGPS